MMYESRNPLSKGRETQDLEQGDVLRGFLIPEAPTGASFGIRRGGSFEWKKPELPAAAILEAEQKANEGKSKGDGPRVMVKIARELDCMVLSNSCDNNAGHYYVLLAPIHPFETDPSEAGELREQLSNVLRALAPQCDQPECEGVALKIGDGGAKLCDACAVEDPTAKDLESSGIIRQGIAKAMTTETRERRQRADEWLQISRAATGHAKSFYLPANPLHKFARSEVDLTEMFAVEPSYVARCLAELNGQRLFGLTQEAARHLQRTIDLFFGRHPREDHAWPSREDLELKVSWLEYEISRGGARSSEYEQELQTVQKLLKEKPGSW